MEIILEGKNLEKAYTVRGDKVLNNVSLSILKGSFTAVMGPSGSGKSTLMYTLSGMETPDAGEVVMAVKKLVLYRKSRVLYSEGNPWGLFFSRLHY